MKIRALRYEDVQTDDDDAEARAEAAAAWPWLAVPGSVWPCLILSDFLNKEEAFAWWCNRGSVLQFSGFLANMGTLQTNAKHFSDHG